MREGENEGMREGGKGKGRRGKEGENEGMRE